MASLLRRVAGVVNDIVVGVDGVSVSNDDSSTSSKLLPPIPLRGGELDIIAKSSRSARASADRPGEFSLAAGREDSEEFDIVKKLRE